MRILVLSPEFPIPAANATRQKIYQLIRGLAPRHHQLSLFAFHSPCEPPQQADVDRILNLGCRDVLTCAWREASFVADLLSSTLELTPHAYRKYRVRAFCETLHTLVNEQSFDVVHCDINMTEMCKYLTGREASVVSPNDSFTRIMLRDARAAHSWPYRLYSLSQAGRFYYAERTFYPRFTKCHVVSQPEADFLRRINPQIDTAIVPIGADVPDRFKPESERRPGCDIVFSGQMANPISVDGALWFHRAVWPLIRQQFPACRLWLVGRAPPAAIQKIARVDPSVVVTGFVDSMAVALESKLLYVGPLVTGAGVKTRILEAMAHGLPVVTTSLGVEGINVVHRQHALVANTPAAFADAVIELLNSPDLRQRLAEAGYKLVKSRYTWEAYACGMERVYEEAVRKHRTESKS